MFHRKPDPETEELRQKLREAQARRDEAQNNANLMLVKLLHRTAIRAMLKKKGLPWKS